MIIKTNPASHVLDMNRSLSLVSHMSQIADVPIANIRSQHLLLFNRKSAIVNRQLKFFCCLSSRRRATCSASRNCIKASMVALTTFYGLVVPSDLVKHVLNSRRRHHRAHRTARDHSRFLPVQASATLLPAPYRPTTACGIEVAVTFTCHKRSSSPTRCPCGWPWALRVPCRSHNPRARRHRPPRPVPQN